MFRLLKSIHLALHMHAILDRIEHKLDTLQADIDVILHDLAHISLKEHKIMALLDDITLAIAANTTATNAIVALLPTITGVDPVLVATLTAQIQANTKALNDAAAAITPPPAP